MMIVMMMMVVVDLDMKQYHFLNSLDIKQIRDLVKSQPELGKYPKSNQIQI